jgi:nucleoside 2-deoxyribosyltransferase
MALIHSADVVMINLDDLSGEGPTDSGTAVEVGYATALERLVFGLSKRWMSAHQTDLGNGRIDGDLRSRVCRRGLRLQRESDAGLYHIGS